MSGSALGRRYERLLFLAAPMSLAAALILFVAVAASNQQVRVLARCLIELANRIESSDTIREEWAKPSTAYGLGYGLQLSFAAIRAGCATEVLKRFDGGVKVEPAKLVEGLRKEASELGKGPIALGGVELPEVTTLSAFGLTVKSKVMTLVLVLQVVLGPVLIVWLGSLYNTRYREAIFIHSARTISDVFPHLLNVYPVIAPTPSLRKYVNANRGIHRAPAIFGVFISIVRTTLAFLVIGPAPTLYVISIFFLASEQTYAWFLYAMGGAVFIFALTAVFAELQPMHVTKTFPGPRPKSE